MTRQRSSLVRPLLYIVGLLAMFGVSKVLPRGSVEHVEARQPSTTGDGGHLKSIALISYGTGYVVAMIMTLCAFALVHWRWLNGTTAFSVVLGLALAQALVHFRCFLHVSLGRSARDDLQLIMFTTVIICLMVGGTLVVLFNLRMRMM